MSKKITRRQAITRTSIAVGGALLGILSKALAAPAAAKLAERPKIVLLIADGWSWQGSEAVDNLGLRMSTFARLQRGGVTFENAFIASGKVEPPYPDLLEKTGYAVHRRDSDFAAFLDNRPAGKPFFFRLESEATRSSPKMDVDTSTITVPPYLPDTPAVRRDIAGYRAALERFDHEAGVLIDRLERDGELSNTLIVMMGADGWPFPRGGETLYDAGTHVPLVVMYQEKIKGGRVSKALVSSAELGATLLQFAGIAEPSKASLIPLILNGGNGAGSFVVTSREQPTDAYPARAIRTQRYLYIRNLFPDRWPAGAPAQQAVTPAQLDRDIGAAFAGIAPSATKTAMIVGRGDPAMDKLLDLVTAKRPAAELYDVHEDPYQLANLAADPAMKAIVTRLDKQLTTELKRNGDHPAG